MECDCGGVLVDYNGSYSISKKNFTFILENIPAFKCMRCDKVLFPDETVEKVQGIVNKIEKEAKEITTGQLSTNLYDY